MFNTLKPAIILSAIALTLTACLGGGSSEPTKYYTIAVESISMPTDGTYDDKRLPMRKFNIEPAYQRTNIVYRESAYDFMFYDLDLWASRPEQMVAQVAAEYIEKSGIFQAVESRASGKPELELLGHIDAIEEIDEGSSQYARLSLRLTLQKPDADAPLWEKRFDERQSVSSREPRLVAEAISKLLGKYMEEAIAAIGSASK
jgi:ABC-type uncharacterized transport system auxiliary subunit